MGLPLTPRYELEIIPLVHEGNIQDAPSFQSIEERKKQWNVFDVGLSPLAPSPSLGSFLRNGISSLSHTFLPPHPRPCPAPQMTFLAGPIEEKKLTAAAKDEDVSLFSSHPLETPRREWSKAAAA